MKFLLVLIVVVVVIAWLLRAKKPPPTPRASEPARANRHESDANAEAMVQCAYCKTHVPLSESVTGPSGIAFCSTEHRALAERRS